MKKSRYRTTLIGILIFILLVVTAYLVGLHQGRSQIEDQRTAFEKQIIQLQKRHAVAGSWSALWKSRSSLCKAAYDLEQKNLGLAELQLREAKTSLAMVSPVLIGADPVQFEEVRRNVAELKLEIGSDVEEQRRIILNTGERLDTLIRRLPKT
jgi:hypothetical protein